MASHMPNLCGATSEGRTRTRRHRLGILKRVGL